MRSVCTAEQIREADLKAAASVGERTLVERAGSAVAARAVQMLTKTYGSTVVIIAGSGHNGVDALLAAERLARRGARVGILRSTDTDGDSLWTEALAKALHSGARTLEEFPSTADLVIDGMVGIGAQGPLRPRAAQLAVAARGIRTLAVDIPSGIDADTGAAAGEAVEAEVTVTFDVLKPGLVVGSGAAMAGLVDVVDVGFGEHSLVGEQGLLHVVDAEDVRRWMPRAGRDDDKRSRGAVGIVAGSPSYPGAAVLCTGGAVVSGAGYVRYAGPNSRRVCDHWPSVVPDAGHVDAVVVGPGLGTGSEVQDRIKDVLDAGLPTVVDADGLSVGLDTLRGGATVITPHQRELKRLTGSDPREDPIAAARAAADDLGCVVLLKGATTVVAGPDGHALLVLTGSPWLSTAGTGDVLAGAIGTYLAAGTPALQAAAAAAFVHGIAGHTASRGAPISADALLRAWPDADRSIRTLDL